MEMYIPTAALQPYVKAFHVIESQGMPLENRVLPDTAIALAFGFCGQVANGHGSQQTVIPAASLAGLRQSARLFNYLPYSGTIVALLKEGMAPAFFREPLHEMKGLTLGLDSLFTASEIARVQDQLFGARHHRARIAIVERFLLANLRPPAADPVAIHAVEAIRQAEGRLPMAGLASDMCLSQDAFEKRFTGLPPRQFFSQSRFW